MAHRWFYFFNVSFSKMVNFYYLVNIQIIGEKKIHICFSISLISFLWQNTLQPLIKIMDSV